MHHEGETEDDNYDPVLLPVENEPACRLVNYSSDEEEVSILSTNENVFEGVSCAPKEMVVPRVGEFWEVRNGSHSMYVTIVEDNPDGQCSICYFEECRNGHYRLNDKKFEDCLEDFVHKVGESKKHVLFILKYSWIRTRTFLQNFSFEIFLAK